MAIDFNKKPLSSGGTNYFEELLGGGKNGIQQININELVPFENQPFKPYSQLKLAELAADIEEHGILSPVLVRALPKAQKYEILAGHNRVAAAKLIELETVPCLVQDVDDDTAMLIMLNTNLNQRAELLPSEKAKAYKMQLDTMKRQGERTDLASRHNVGKSDDLASRHNVDKLNSADALGEMLNLSGRQIQRFIRLTFLIPEFMDMVDEKKMPMLAGVELSYLEEEYQDNLFFYCENNRIKTIGVNEAHQIRELGTFENSDLDVVFGREQKEKKPAAEKTISIKLPLKLLSPTANNKVIDEPLMIKIAKTIDDYFKGKKDGEE